MLVPLLSLLLAAPPGDLLDPWATRGESAAAPASELLDPWASTGRATPGRTSVGDLKDPFRRSRNGTSRTRAPGGPSPDLIDPFRGPHAAPGRKPASGLRDPFGPAK
jgi:hypothetical protein